MNLLLNEKLFPGTVLQLEFTLQGGAGPIQAFGKIVWTKEISGQLNEKKGRCFATGIQFLEIKAQDKPALERFINEKVSQCKNSTNPFHGQ